MGKNVAHKFIPKLENWVKVVIILGCFFSYCNLFLSLLQLHGRSKEQRYGKLADWDYISECKKTCMTMPFFGKFFLMIGNGDVMSFEDYEYNINNYNIDGVMIGRF